MEWETLKIYIETSLANSFIKLSKSLVTIAIFLIQKPNNSLQLYVNYKGLNNLIQKKNFRLAKLN